MIEIPKQVKGLIFDLDGTIANTMQNHFLSWREAILPHGIDFNAELFKSLTGKPREATIIRLNEMFGTNMDPIAVGKVKGETFKKMVNQTKEISVVADVVRKYHTVLPMSIGTGSTKNGAKTTLEVIGMNHFFDIVITANDIQNPKPHPETFLKCADLMGINPKECIVFEDGILGMQAAKEAGMLVVDVNDYFKMEFTV
ncbi:HAD superfamily hydrolase (TIGR01509 family)/beta-phosphoglucomutase family hydrolase [Lutibacter oceani]|uniref:HAD superfamily hydrolase (TIGR01509 family)/beta-phosphoglucomutase family hydrolase n=1 Tax=Lutibacter oceani TaxID=1853311 RepID=A0A3D9S404_9FLAO|nr:beta-phosphoglucomutase family hydrolase [Lutibacter oceani]REE83565.1 HAD superfamily hydrolase (TIGR01509 family)/beta-phosphoglucomutase family hydrolase [Lutibacter oceani]